MKFVILGASGLIGRALLDLLADTESVSEVVCIGRRELVHPSKKVRSQVIDFESPDGWPALTADVLCSTFGTTLKDAGSKSAMRKVDLDYQLAVARWGAQQNIAHYILVSSIGVNANSWLFYPQIRGQLEEAVANLAFPSTTIFRPSLLLGERPQRRFGEVLMGALCPPALLERIPFLRHYAPIEAQLVARAMLRAAEEPEAGLRRIEGVSIKEFARRSSN